MLKRFSVLVLVLTLLLCPVSKAFAGGFTISGTVRGADRAWVYLSYLPDSGSSAITDSAWVSQGQFSFSGQISTPTFGILYGSAPQLQESFMFEPGLNLVAIDTTGLEGFRVSGGEATALYRRYSMLADSFDTYRRDIQLYMSDPKAPKDSARQAEYTDRYYISLSEEEDQAASLISAHRSNFACAYILYYKFSGEGNINKGLAILSTLDTAVRRSKYARLLLQKAAAFSQRSSGMPAPALSLPDSAGHTISLSELRGRYVLVDFWASWCTPCRYENPGLVRAWQRFHDQGFEIVSVSMDSDRRAWLHAIEKDGLSWINLCDLRGWEQSTAAAAYEVHSMPTNFLIGPDGNIIAKNLMGAGLEYELENVLGGK